MSTVEQIESAIMHLHPDDFRRLSDWISELDQRRWDEQLERECRGWPAGRAGDGGGH